MSDRTDSLSLRAARTRNHLSDLVDDLQHQITPAELVSQLAGYRAPNATPGLGQTIVAQISKNPLACALIAAGIGWLMLSDRLEKKPRPQRRPRAVKRAASPHKKRTRHKKAA